MANKNILEIEALVTYDKETGIFKWNSLAKNKHSVIINSKTSGGYLRASHDGHRILLHRLAWIIERGEIPEKYEIDHINGVRDDNRISNLRCVSKQVQQQNKRIYKKNTSGVHGVRWSKTRKKWRVQVTINKKQIKLGDFDHIGDAIKARREAEVRCGVFHENHGNTPSQRYNSTAEVA